MNDNNFPDKLEEILKKTVKNILNHLKTAEKRFLLSNAHVIARQKREVIGLIENYLSERKSETEVEL